MLPSGWCAAQNARCRYFGTLETIGGFGEQFEAAQEVPCRAGADGIVKGQFIMGQNPLVGAVNTDLVEKGLSKLEWLVVRGFAMTESATRWRRGAGPVRSGPGDGSGPLAHVNAVISCVVAVQYPLGEVLWEELRKSRDWLAAVLERA